MGEVGVQCVSRYVRLAWVLLVSRDITTSGIGNFASAPAGSPSLRMRGRGREKLGVGTNSFGLGE